MSRFIRPFAALSLSCMALWAADAVPAEQKAKPYPLDICLVSGDRLDGGDMGGPVTLVQGDQEWKFCCRKCIKTFNKDPATWQEKLTGAVERKAAGSDAKAGK